MRHNMQTKGHNTATAGNKPDNNYFKKEAGRN